MPYDRAKAITYAETYWTAVCADNHFGAQYGHPSIETFRHKLKAPSSDWDAIFVRTDGTEKGVFRKRGAKDSAADIVFETQDALEDCAHYLSQCVRAGGAAIDTQWGVGLLIQSLRALPDTKTLMERGDIAAGNRLIKAGLFKKGDMIGYFHNTKGKEFGYGHSAMFVGNDGITCHSTCRFKGKGDSFDDDWSLAGRDFTYTFIHFSSDDNLDPALAKSLKGWWKVEYRGAAAFYYLFENGIAHKLTAPPRSWNEVPRGGEPAYWFTDNSTIRFAWKNSSDLEEWTINRPSTVTRAKLNDVVGSAAKQGAPALPNFR